MNKAVTYTESVHVQLGKFLEKLPQQNFCIFSYFTLLNIKISCGSLADPHPAMSDSLTLFSLIIQCQHKLTNSVQFLGPASFNPTLAYMCASVCPANREALP